MHLQLLFTLSEVRVNFVKKLFATCVDKRVTVWIHINRRKTQCKYPIIQYFRTKTTFSHLIKKILLLSTEARCCWCTPAFNIWIAIKASLPIDRSVVYRLVSPLWIWNRSWRKKIIMNVTLLLKEKSHFLRHIHMQKRKNTCTCLSIEKQKQEINRNVYQLCFQTICCNQF